MVSIKKIWPFWHDLRHKLGIYKGLLKDCCKEGKLPEVGNPHMRRTQQ